MCVGLMGRGWDCAVIWEHGLTPGVSAAIQLLKYCIWGVIYPRLSKINHHINGEKWGWAKHGAGWGGGGGVGDVAGVGFIDKWGGTGEVAIDNGTNWMLKCMALIWGAYPMCLQCDLLGWKHGVFVQYIHFTWRIWDLKMFMHVVVCARVISSHIDVTCPLYAEQLMRKTSKLMWRWVCWSILLLVISLSICGMVWYITFVIGGCVCSKD